MLEPARRSRAALALALSAPAPTVGALCAYVWLPGAVGQSIYMLLRLWIALFPLLWWLRIERRAPSGSLLDPRWRREALVGSLLLSGVVLSVVYGGWSLFGERLLDPVALRQTVETSGIGTPAKFLMAGVAISFGNSLVEEFFWRWFVGTRAELLVGSRWAAPLSAALFTSHHVVSFCVLFGPAAGLAASAGVFLAGLVWSLLYQRWRSIWPGWCIHVVADLAGLSLGWHVLFGG
ncbi:MAG: CPBP family intramembrane metalloprotease [Planctomycetota bacterium]|nr:CPBP family intramembrane metalloprotease [Planctomycetota bacterium]